MRAGDLDHRVVGRPIEDPVHQVLGVVDPRPLEVPQAVPRCHVGQPQPPPIPARCPPIARSAPSLASRPARSPARLGTFGVPGRWPGRHPRTRARSNWPCSGRPARPPCSAAPARHPIARPPAARRPSAARRPAGPSVSRSPIRTGEGLLEVDPGRRRVHRTVGQFVVVLPFQRPYAVRAGSTRDPFGDQLPGVVPGLDVGVRGPDHLHDQRRVQGLHHVDVGVEAERVDPAGISGDVAGQVVGPADRQEQLHVGPQPAFARFADDDGALGRHRPPLLPVGVRPGHGQVDRGQRGQPLRRLQVGVRLVLVVGALGLAQQRGDPGQILVTHLSPPGVSLSQVGGQVRDPSANLHPCLARMPAGTDSAASATATG